MRLFRNAGPLALLVISLAACSDAASGEHVARSSAGEVQLSPAEGVPVQGDAMAMRADSLLRVGHAWRATELLAPRLVTPASAPAEVRLVGARAAMMWEGFTEVKRILDGADWLDSRFGGEGRELLARAALEQGSDARADALAALRAATDSSARVTRRVLLARANERAGDCDSAAAGYREAAARLPRLRDWLLLRAAGVTRDEGARQAMYKSLDNPVARTRVALTEAQSLERTGSLDAAARAFTAANDPGAAFRVQALAARDATAQAALAQRIVQMLPSLRRRDEIRQSLDVLDGLKQPQSAAEALVVARAAAVAGVWSRAVDAYARAGVPSLAANDRMRRAEALAAAGRTNDALTAYADLATAGPQAAAAAYQRARLLLQSGAGAQARQALRAIPARFESSAEASAPALLLLADLQVDDDDLAGARASLQQLVSRYPSSVQAPVAMFRRGLLAWAANASNTAALFDSVWTVYSGHDEATAARYWAGRALERAGQKDAAATHWRAILDSDPLSYYAQRAARRLGVSAIQVPASGTEPTSASVDSASARVSALRRLGMDVEARFELDALEAAAPSASPVVRAATASAFVALGEPARAIRIATRALAKGERSRALFLAAFPVLHDDVLSAESRRNDLDPALVAGLIRQESSWNPHALSPAGARGLMQLMPTVGAAIARSHRYPVWNTSLLYEPDVSLQLGTAHLASSLRRGTPVVRALAAYNAGGSRVARWLARPDRDDAELFAEWIPYSETRDYVRIVQRNAAIYSQLLH